MDPEKRPLFEWDDADIILRATHGTDSRDFRVHKLLLSLTSPVFHEMFRLPQPPSETSAIQTVDMHESPRALEVVLRFIYPSENTPVVNDLTLLSEALVAADKYDIAVARTRLRRSFEELARTEPLKVYAIARRIGYENEMKIALSHSTSIHLPSLTELPKEFESMSAAEYHSLIRFHDRYRKGVANIAAKTDYSDRYSAAPKPIDFRTGVSAAIEGLPLDFELFMKRLLPGVDRADEFNRNVQIIRSVFKKANELNLAV